MPRNLDEAISVAQNTGLQVDSKVEGFIFVGGQQIRKSDFDHMVESRHLILNTGHAGNDIELLAFSN